MRHDRFERDDLTRRILDRTSGRPCERASRLLGDRWDGALAPDDENLLDAHLDGCAGCRSLADVMAAVRPHLPRLAERAPGPRFTAGVLAATTGIRGARPRPTPWLERLADRAADAARVLWDRPRLALEIAWTATTILTLVMWSPVAPDRAPAARVVAAGAMAAPAAVGWVETRLNEGVAFAEDLVDPSAADVVRALADLGAIARAAGGEVSNLVRPFLESMADDDRPDEHPASDLARPEE